MGQEEIVPIVKIDQGLADRADDVQLMRDIAGLDALLARSAQQGVFGTKERSVIFAANPIGIDRVVDQQFEVGERVLVPILEPEVDIYTPDKGAAELLLEERIQERLAGLGDRAVALKISIPTVDGFCSDLIAHPTWCGSCPVRGYPRDEANARLARNPGLIASFSWALLDGLSAQQSDEEFDRVLADSIEPIYQASVA